MSTLALEHKYEYVIVLKYQEVSAEHKNWVGPTIEGSNVDFYKHVFLGTSVS